MAVSDRDGGRRMVLSGGGARRMVPSDGDGNRRTALSEELRFLARRHPRELWAARADLGELARFWLERHAMFRELDAVIREGTAAALHDGSDPAAIKAWLARQLGWTLWQLEEHHQVEDHHYFPLFRRAEPRLAAGFELLERDHLALHVAIGSIGERAKAVLVNPGNARVAFRADLARFHEAQIDLGRELVRHLDDEEDLVIPLLLERGERSLLGAT